MQPRSSAPEAESSTEPSSAWLWWPGAASKPRPCLMALRRGLLCQHSRLHQVLPLSPHRCTAGSAAAQPDHRLPPLPCPASSQSTCSHCTQLGTLKEVGLNVSPTLAGADGRAGGAGGDRREQAPPPSPPLQAEMPLQCLAGWPSVPGMLLRPSGGATQGLALSPSSSGSMAAATCGAEHCPQSWQEVLATGDFPVGHGGERTPVT